MGSTKSSSPTYNTKQGGILQPPLASFEISRADTDNGSAEPQTGYFMGMPKMPEKRQEQPSYLGQSQQETAQMERPKSMVGEVRKAGSQMFSEALGVNTEGSQQEEGLKTPGVSTSRMAGEFLQAFDQGLADKLDPSKAAEEEVDPSRYGIGSPTKTSGAQYTASASSAFG